LPPSWAAVAARCTAVDIERDERTGDKPSDHAPVIADYNI
jgi:exonuclease III